MTAPTAQSAEPSCYVDLSQTLVDGLVFMFQTGQSLPQLLAFFNLGRRWLFFLRSIRQRVAFPPSIFDLPQQVTPLFIQRNELINLFVTNCRILVTRGLFDDVWVFSQ